METVLLFAMLLTGFGLVYVWGAKGLGVCSLILVVLAIAYVGAFVDAAAYGRLAILMGWGMIAAALLGSAGVAFAVRSYQRRTQANA